MRSFIYSSTILMVTVHGEHRYSSETLRFGKVDVDKFPELAREYQIDASTASWQLPTLILFQGGTEIGRLPQIDVDGNATKTILDKVHQRYLFLADLHR
jgi:hypothetical protein